MRIPFIIYSVATFVSDNLFKSSINTMSEEQRETPTIYSHSDECEHPLSEHSSKVKLIKKQKQVEKGHQNKLTKEQRTKIQKQKNREAAQRSRDQHKEYVTNLQQEVKLLKEQIELNKQFCFKCRRDLNNQDRFFEEELDNDDLIFGHPHIFQEEQVMQVQTQKVEVVDLPKEEEFFLRNKNEDEDFSYLKMMLFIAMIAIGVFLYPNGNTTADNSRHLLEVYQAPISKPLLMDDFKIDINDSVNGHSPQMFVDLTRGLVVRNSVINEQCLDSLIENQPFSLTNLRTSHPSLAPRMGEGILLCSFENQKASFVAQDEGHSAFLKLYLMGAEIKEMVTANSPIKKFIETNLQLNGIYRINAQVKQVELISHHNCLL